MATFNSLSNVNSFCNNYNHNNGYNGLKVGQKIIINGTSSYTSAYNNYWEIAGFDLEFNNIAADGSIKSNGYGIFLIPCSCIKMKSNNSISFSWWDSSRTLSDPIPYKSSTLHTTILPSISNDLKSILGSHLINRNILLSSNGDTSGNGSNAYTWTTGYATMFSICQLGLYGIGNKYDNGEANYKLPIYNFKGFYDFETNTSYSRYTRAVTSNAGQYGYYYYPIAYSSKSFEDRFGTGDFVKVSTENMSAAIIPLICIR